MGRRLTVLLVPLLVFAFLVPAAPASAHGTCESAGGRVFVNSNGRLRVRGVHECTRMHGSIGISASVEKRRDNGTWWNPWGFSKLALDRKRVVLRDGPGGCKPGVYRVKWKASVYSEDGTRIGHVREWTAKARRIYC